MITWTPLWSSVELPHIKVRWLYNQVTLEWEDYAGLSGWAHYNQKDSYEWNRKAGKPESEWYNIKKKKKGKEKDLPQNLHQGKQPFSDTLTLTHSDLFRTSELQKYMMLNQGCFKLLLVIICYSSQTSFSPSIKWDRENLSWPGYWDN